MTRITVIGAGLTGLTTALLLARDDHAVTVLERDAAEPEGNADALWRDWKRPGVSQFRLPHQMIAYWRELMGGWSCPRSSTRWSDSAAGAAARSTCCPSP